MGGGHAEAERLDGSVRRSRRRCCGEARGRRARRRRPRRGAAGPGRPAAGTSMGDSRDRARRRTTGRALAACGARASGSRRSSESTRPRNRRARVGDPSPGRRTRPPPEPEHTGADCPYRGLQPFGREDEEEFFGRDRYPGLARPDLGVAIPRGLRGIRLRQIFARARRDGARAPGRGGLVVVLARGRRSRSTPSRVVLSRTRRRHRHRPVRGTTPSGLPDAHVASSRRRARGRPAGRRVSSRYAPTSSAMRGEPRIGPLSRRVSNWSRPWSGRAAEAMGAPAASRAAAGPGWSS